MSELHMERVSYTPKLRKWLNDRSRCPDKGHYLNNAPPGSLFAVGVWRAADDFLPGIARPVGPLLGLCIVGRPNARMLPQDGSVGEITRVYLVPGLPRGTASELLRYAADLARHRGMASLIAYHDRTRHTGCIYRKAGFRKDGTTATKSNPGSWSTRGGRKSAQLAATPKRRWRLQLHAP
jgi:hypothetical protein